MGKYQMGKAKNKKALLKRLKITSTGKVLKRRAGQNHFNAKDSGATKMHKRGTETAPPEYRDQFRALLPDHL